MSKPRLYKGKYMIALYEVDLTNNEEGVLLTLENNIRELMRYFEIEQTRKEFDSIRHKIHQAVDINKTKVITIDDEKYKIHLILEKGKK